MLVSIWAWTGGGGHGWCGSRTVSIIHRGAHCFTHWGSLQASLHAGPFPMPSNSSLECERVNVLPVLRDVLPIVNSIPNTNMMQATI